MDLTWSDDGPPPMDAPGGLRKWFKRAFLWAHPDKHGGGDDAVYGDVTKVISRCRDALLST